MSTIFAATLTGTAIDERVSPSALLVAIVRFEVALAREQAALGIIPADAAEAIDAAASGFVPDEAAVISGGHTVGTPVVALLDELGARVHAHRQGARRWLHHGATSQDALDSGIVIALSPLVREAIVWLGRSRAAAAALARTHERSPVLARTLLQAAGITTFGAKAALWSVALGRSERRLAAAADEGLAIQLAGGTGTGQAFSAEWPELQRRLARALGLGVARGGNWQSARDEWVGVLMQMALATAVAAKIAGDLALMSQTEIGEISEPAASGAMSTALPHKQNPVLAMRIRAAGLVVSGHAGVLLECLSRVEHERSLGAWQAELAVAPSLVAHALGALETLSTLLEGLVFHPERARGNIERTSGLIFADRAAAELAGVGPRQQALSIVERACREVRDTGVHLRDVLTREMDAEALERVFDPNPQIEASARAARRALADGE
jgi:3-carboxy-cis,cis-muconate cycloisomerase